jgi:ComF family protein
MLALPETLTAAKSWLDAALSFFYPNVCQFCGEESATKAQGFVGLICQRKVKLIERPFCERCGLPFAGEITTSFECANCRNLDLSFSKARSAALAEGMVLDLIHRYKYSRALWLEPFLAGLLVAQALPELRVQDWDMIVPVPLHRLKQSEREFNQAERLARVLSNATQIPLHSKLLRRVQPTRTQTRLSRRERLDNVRKAFALYPGTRLNGERIVLIDDVFTTGATTSACARILLDSNASNVCVWTVARGGWN